MEDVGIALGQAVRQALGDMKGITRYADVHLPMDETLTRVCHRRLRAALPGLPDATLPRHKIGTFDTELVREFFQAFAMNAGITLHVETLYGDNAHHIAESCFKGAGAGPAGPPSPSIRAGPTRSPIDQGGSLRWRGRRAYTVHLPRARPPTD